MQQPDPCLEEALLHLSLCSLWSKPREKRDLCSCMMASAGKVALTQSEKLVETALVAALVVGHLLERLFHLAIRQLDPLESAVGGSLVWVIFSSFSSLLHLVAASCSISKLALLSLLAVVFLAAQTMGRR